jgi:rhodanese-related sulfurtransferase
VAKLISGFLLFKVMVIKTKIVLALSILFLITACSVPTTPSAPTPEPALTTIVEWVPTPTSGGAPLTEAEVPRVDLERTRVAIASGEAIVIDVRSQEAYALSHIPGALNIQLSEFEMNSAGVNLDKDQWIITYCTWMNEHTSARAAFILLQNGYTRVSALLGGFIAWIEADYPVEP